MATWRKSIVDQFEDPWWFAGMLKHMHHMMKYFERFEIKILFLKIFANPIEYRKPSPKSFHWSPVKSWVTNLAMIFPMEKVTEEFPVEIIYSPEWLKRFVHVN